MGLYDSFYDEDSKCPKCKSKITTDWQTKRLESMLESWHKGDFVQYRKLETIPERKRKKKYGDLKFASSLRHTNEFLSDAPLLLNGKLPVHTYCKKCESRLEAYAKVVSGAFTGIVEIEADGKEKEFVRIRPDATARSLRQDFEDTSLTCKNPANTRKQNGCTWNGFSALYSVNAASVSSARRL